jgi:hypothetical protein
MTTEVDNQPQGAKAPTVGAEALKRLKDPDTKQGIIDTQREIDKEYLNEVEKCLHAHKDMIEDQGMKGVFVIVLTKKERTMPNVIRRYFFCRKSLPSVQYDQTVWRYNHRKQSELELIWVIPDVETCLNYLQDECPQDEVTLWKMVRMMFAGRLRESAKKKFGIDDV